MHKMTFLYIDLIVLWHTNSSISHSIKLQKASLRDTSAADADCQGQLNWHSRAVIYVEEKSISIWQVCFSVFIKRCGKRYSLLHKYKLILHKKEKNSAVIIKERIISILWRVCHYKAMEGKKSFSIYNKILSW